MREDLVTWIRHSCFNWLILRKTKKVSVFTYLGTFVFTTTIATLSFMSWYFLPGYTQILVYFYWFSIFTKQIINIGWVCGAQQSNHYQIISILFPFYIITYWALGSLSLRHHYHFVLIIHWLSVLVRPYQ